LNRRHPFTAVDAGGRTEFNDFVERSKREGGAPTDF
jgi:hypothetical protein